MRSAFLHISIICICAAPSCFSDVVRYRDGRVIRGVILEDNGSRITIMHGGARLTIPRSLVESVEKESPPDDAGIGEEWKKLDEHFKEESAKAAAEAPPAAVEEPPPTPLPQLQPPENKEQEPIVFPAEPPAPVIPPPVTAEQKKFEWMREVHTAIREKRVIPGMTMKEVTSAWGWPAWTHPVHSMDTFTDRWTYHRAGEGIVNVYFSGGVVVSVAR